MMKTMFVFLLVLATFSSFAHADCLNEGDKVNAIRIGEIALNPVSCSPDALLIAKYTAIQMANYLDAKFRETGDISFKIAAIETKANLALIKTEILKRDQK